MRYKVQLKRIMRYPKEPEVFSKGFDEFEQAIEYYNLLISINTCNAREVIILLYDNDDCLGVWNSEVYKDENKTKTSNL